MAYSEGLLLELEHTGKMSLLGQNGSKLMTPRTLQVKLTRYLQNTSLKHVEAAGGGLQVAKEKEVIMIAL